MSKGVRDCVAVVRHSPSLQACSLVLSCVACKFRFNSVHFHPPVVMLIFSNHCCRLSSNKLHVWLYYTFCYCISSVWFIAGFPHVVVVVVLRRILCCCCCVAGSTSQRVGADVRMLYAIGELDDFELLKKEIAESHFLVAGVEARVKERLRAHKRSSSPEVSLPPHAPLSILCVHAMYEC